MVGGGALFGLFAYLGGAPGVFIDRFQLTPADFGMLFGGCAAGFIAASQINPRACRRFGAGGCCAPGRACRCWRRWRWRRWRSAMSGRGGWSRGRCCCSMASMGFTTPNATVGALSGHAGHAGSASALMGTMQFCLGAVSGLLVGVLADGTARPMALLMLLGAGGAALADLCRPKRP